MGMPRHEQGSGGSTTLEPQGGNFVKHASRFEVFVVVLCDVFEIGGS